MVKRTLCKVCFLLLSGYQGDVVLLFPSADLQMILKHVK